MRISRRSIAVAAALWFCSAPGLRAVEPLGDLTGPWQLFVDDYAIEQRQSLTRTYHPFTRYAGNPVIRADRPWEGTVIYMYGNVLPNEDRTGYRIWYHSLPKGEGNRLLYAESSNGISWTKPNLGNVLYNGSTNNNIYFQRTSGDHIASLIHTPWDSPDRQYKLMNFNSALGGFLGALSPNGTDFVSDPANPLVTGTGDVGNFVYDFHRDEYLGYVKLNTYVDGLRRRCVAITRTANWTNWPPAYIIIKPDEIDDRWTTGTYKTDFYGLCAFPYESMYVGFLWVLRVTGYIDVCQDGPIFVELVTSRDGVNWKREEGDRPPILPLGNPGTWDAGMVFTAQQPLVENGQVKLYYGGIDGEHCANNWIGGIGLATLRKDGFASLDAGAAPGTLTTRPLLNASGSLRLNYRAATGGWVRVEVLDANGEVVPGYSASECTPLQGDSVDAVVRWGGIEILPGIAPLQLRFTSSQASLYSFRTADPIIVLQPPVIVNQPTTQRVDPATTVEFSLAAGGDEPLAWRWRKNGADLTDDGRYSGASTPTLTIAAVDGTDVGSYSCAVSNAGGTTESRSVDLKIGHWIFSPVLLPTSDTSAVAGMSTDGSVVCGTSGGRPLIWTASQGTRDIGLPAGATQAAAADVLVRPDGSLLATVNATTASAVKAMRWAGTIAGNGDYTELKPLAGPRYWSARGMGTDGSEIWIVGSTAAGGDGGGREAVIHRQSTQITSLIPLPTSGRDHSDAHDVSDTGHTSGQFQYNSSAPPNGGTRSGFLFTRRGAPIAINSLAGAPSAGQQAAALCISRNGTIQGGWSYVAGGGSSPKPVIWNDPVTPAAIPLLPGADAGEVRALSADGSMAAGSMWNSANPTGSAQAFVWDAAAGTRSLASLLTLRGVDLSNLSLTDVVAMSADSTMFCGNGLTGGKATGWVYTFADAAPALPLILRHPRPLSLPVGESARFEIEAFGEAPLAYRWQLNGADLSNAGLFAGTDTAVLSVLAITGSVEGDYRCRVTNALGEAFSNAARLTLLTPAPDLDRDGDVDQDDYGVLQKCFSGPTVPQPDPACAGALLDVDDDVDLKDLTVFLKCFGPPGTVPGLRCAD